MTLDLFARSVGDTRDPLDRFFTPDALASLIVTTLAEHIAPPARILEPSVGGGAFVRAARAAWSSAHIIGCDVDPLAEGLRLVDEAHVGDFLSMDLRADLAIGNPPFSADRAIPHVEAARRAAPVVAFILPWSPLGGVDRWESLMHASPPVHAWPIRPRPWPASVRETALFVWSGPAETTSIRWLPRWR